MKVKLNLSLDSWIKKELESQAEKSSRTKSEHVKELVNAEKRRRKR